VLSMSSCVDTLANEGFPTIPVKQGAVVEPDRVGKLVLATIGDNVYPQILWLYNVTKKLKLKYKVTISYTGNTTTNYKCGCGFAIKKVVIFQKDFMSDLIETLNNLINMMVILQLLNSIMGFVV